MKLNNDTLKYIAHLLYAIAKADKSLSLEEYVKLRETLYKDWQHIGNKSVVSIIQYFNVLQQSSASPSDCFDEFVIYLNKHPEIFTKELKSLLIKTGNSIAYTYAKINKSELTYMAKLSLAFKNIST